MRSRRAPGAPSSTLIEPASMPTMPSIALMAVVLPALLGSTKPVTRPMGTDYEIGRASCRERV